MPTSVKQLNELREMNDSQRRAVEYKLAHRHATLAEVAAAIGLSKFQAQRIMASDAVQDALAAITEDAIEQAVSLLRAALQIAANTLTSICKDKKAAHRDRIAAAMAIFASAKELGVYEDRDPEGDMPAAIRGFTLEGVEDEYSGAASN